MRALRLHGRRTWRFFTTFVGPEDHALPPDNFQEDPHPVVAHRTSPTNIGLYLLSTVAARDFGWIGRSDALVVVAPTSRRPGHRPVLPEKPWSLRDAPAQLQVVMGARTPALVREIGRESDLYPPVKAFLEAQGYMVKGEVRGCDAVGTRGDEPPVIVELKRQFNLALVLQGVDRLSLTDRVYLAVARPRGRGAVGPCVHHRSVRALCRRLGLGLLTVDTAPPRVDVLVDPAPYRPRKKAKRLGRLLGEHARRVGDPTRGGVTRTPIVTAYRQEALRCALLIRAGERANLKALRETGLVPNAARIAQRDVYGWFRRVSRATYTLTERAARDLARFAASGALPPPTVSAGAPAAAATSPDYARA